MRSLLRIFQGILSFGPPGGVKFEDFVREFRHITGFDIPSNLYGFPDDATFLMIIPFNSFFDIFIREDTMMIRKRYSFCSVTVFDFGIGEDISGAEDTDNDVHELEIFLP